MLLLSRVSEKVIDKDSTYTGRAQAESGLKSDEELLRLSVKQPVLFKLLIERYEDAFRRKAKSIVGDRDEVDDILQETFTRIYLHAHNYKPQVGASVSSWLYAILTNVSLTYYQKLKRRGTLLTLDENFEETFAEPASQSKYEKTLTEDYVVSILVRMPATLSRILKLHFLEDMPQLDIARELGISVMAVKARIFRAKKEFRKIDLALARQTHDEH